MGREGEFGWEHKVIVPNQPCRTGDEKWGAIHLVAKEQEKREERRNDDDKNYNELDKMERHFFASIPYIIFVWPRTLSKFDLYIR